MNQGLCEYAANLRSSLWENKYDIDLLTRERPHSFLTMKEAMVNWVEVHPEKPHIVTNSQCLTYRDSNTLACKLGNALSEMGCRKGDRITIILPNIPEYILCYMACYKCGFVAAGFNPRSTATEIEEHMSMIQSETVIIIDDHAAKIDQIMKKGDITIQNVIVLYRAESEERKVSYSYDFEEIVSRAADSEPDAKVFSHDMQILSITGGTTGISKKCTFTNSQIVSDAYIWMNWMASGLGEDGLRILALLPMTHNYGMQVSINYCLVAGGTVVIAETFTIDDVLGLIDEHKPTFFPTVPSFLVQMINHPQINEHDLTSLKVIICGSAPLTLKTLNSFRKLTNARVVEGYGMTETLTVSSITPVLWEGKYGSIGVPLPDTCMIIVDLKTGDTAMPPMEIGEIIFRGPRVISEYWENPEETRLALRDGWMHSGDVGYMDEDGFFYIVDRKKDMIVRGGFNVFSREVDEVLSKHPKILDSCTIGYPDERLGEVVMSCVVLKPGEKLSAEEVIEYCREYLIAYKVPKYVSFVEEIPKTRNNKPCRIELKEQMGISVNAVRPEEQKGFL